MSLPKSNQIRSDQMEENKESDRERRCWISIPGPRIHRMQVGLRNENSKGMLQAHKCSNSGRWNGWRSLVLPLSASAAAATRTSSLICCLPSWLLHSFIHGGEYSAFIYFSSQVVVCLPAASKSFLRCSVLGLNRWILELHAHDQRQFIVVGSSSVVRTRSISH